MKFTYNTAMDLLIHINKEFNVKASCEIGVQRGVMSKRILQAISSIEIHHLIDPWEHQTNTNYQDGANVIQEEQEERLNICKQNLEPWSSKTNYIRGYSSEVSDQIEDESLDFIYIDGRHDYVGLLQDLNLYLKKMKPGSIMAGHDYETAETGHDEWKHCIDGTINMRGPKGAVDDFAEFIGISPYIQNRECWRSWAIFL